MKIFSLWLQYVAFTEICTWNLLGLVSRLKVFPNLWKILWKARFEQKLQHLFLKKKIKKLTFHLGRFLPKYRVKEVTLQGNNYLTSFWERNL